ncbi:MULTISPECIES: hypothetical protein [unclassified Kribbella]|uniref:hypothetical protein n=1 Tax=unclassified Kribbella TaxID=2644121 RepID=UPI0030194C69
MSNQQPYGQPQYGPQFGGYPPPPPPRKSKAGLIVFCLVVALVVIGSGIFVVSRFSGGSDDTAGGASTPVAVEPATQAPTQPPSTGGSPSAPPSRPANPSAPPPAPCNGCFPGITVNGALRQLKAKGFACKEDRVLGIECVKGKLEVGIDRDYTLKNYIENIDVGGRAGGKGDYPQGPREAFATLNAGLPGVLPIFIADASIRQQIVTFTARNAGHADNGPSTVRDGKAGNYRLSCHGVSGATVGKGGKSASSYSTSVNIYGPSAY